MKNIVFWDMTPCSLAQIYWRLGRKPINFYQLIRCLVLHRITLQNDKLFHSEKILMVFIISMTRKPSYFKVVHVMFLFSFYFSIQHSYQPYIWLCKIFRMAITWDTASNLWRLWQQILRFYGLQCHVLWYKILFTKVHGVVFWNTVFSTYASPSWCTLVVLLSRFT